jgi:c(7)-type cytochrome triheme protein
MDAARRPVTFRQLFRNYVSLAGAVIAGVGFGTNIFLILLDLLVPSHNPYVGIVTYMLLPGITIAGLGLTVAGAVIRFVRLRHGREFLVLPQLDLNLPRHRVVLAASLTALFLFLGLSAVGGYQAYHFTDSVQFCGQACHAVMNPEYTAYQDSAHARVPCASCHIGPGAEWFVRSKLSGSYQIYSVLFNKYPRPIPTPIHNLRPAQQTCEQCHWPAKFWGEQLATRVHYASDERNTRREVNLLIKTGGGGVRGLNQGIHWHMNISEKVWYIASDERRQVIPWMRAEDSTGRVTEYTSTDNPLTAEQRQRAEMRRMDCVDCHNRPSHRYLPPTRAVDLSLEAGRLPADLPFIKKLAVEAMVQPYATAAEADQGIERHIRAFYEKQYPHLAKAYEERLRPAVEEVKRAFHQNFFPEMKVNWQVYPDNIGHKEFPGCFRCHDGKHVNEEGIPLNSSCSICHDFLQATPAGLQRVAATPAFAHPWKLGGKHARISCDTCHTGGPAKPPTCGGCHKIGAPGTPMASLTCNQCHQNDQQVKPVVSCQKCHAERAGLHKAATHSGAGCSACHAPHAWAPAPRETCLTCHADKTQHNPGNACAQCHAFGVKGAAAGPPAITFASAESSPGPVTFTHASHLARGAKCADCHPGLFKMRRGGASLTMDAMAAGKACGACHNGKKAFEAMDAEKCATCHKA